MLIAGGEEFSTDNVIEKVLKQDLGPDPSIATSTPKMVFRNEIEQDELLE